MFPKASAVILLGLVAVAMSLPEKALRYSVTIQPPQNSSLCVRTKAYEWEGAMMRLLDCDRVYQFYDGEKNHFVSKDEEFDGSQLITTWAPAETAFGLSGCFYPLNGKIRAVSCYDGVPLEFWNVIELDSEESIFQLQSKGTEKCIGVPEVNDEVDLEEVTCDESDPLQQWKFNILTKAE